MNKFSKLNLSEKMVAALEKINFKEMTTVQEKIIPLLLKNKNIVCQAKTGSGKTHSFLVPLFEKLKKKGKIQTIIIAPTLELAQQIFTNSLQIKELIKSDVEVKFLVQGVDGLKVKSKMNNSIPDIIIGTPGKICDILIDSKEFSLKEVSRLIIDEVDMIFDLGFTKELDLIFKKVNDAANYWFFSATIPKNISDYIKRFDSQIKIIKISDQDDSSYLKGHIKHYLVNTKHQDKNVILRDILGHINFFLALVFVNKKEKIKEVLKSLSALDYKVIALHSDLDARERKKIIKNIRDLKYHIVVASDVMARGIDVEGISHIFSLDIPYDEKYYIHRSGRTGRNGTSGQSYLFYNNDDLNTVTKLSQKLHIEFNFVNWTNDQFVIQKKVTKSKRKEFDVKILGKIKLQKALSKKRGIKPNYKKKLKKDLKSILKNEARQAQKQKQKKLRKQISQQRKLKMEVLDK